MAVYIDWNSWKIARFSLPLELQFEIFWLFSWLFCSCYFFTDHFNMKKIYSHICLCLHDLAYFSMDRDSNVVNWMPFPGRIGCFNDPGRITAISAWISIFIELSHLVIVQQRKEIHMQPVFMCFSHLPAFVPDSYLAYKWKVWFMKYLHLRIVYLFLRNASSFGTGVFSMAHTHLSQLFYLRHTEQIFPFQYNKLIGLHYESVKMSLY